jgi:hypothetical protein
MPNCFTLRKKGAKELSNFSAIDEELCALLGEPVHEKYYVADWYNSIGLALAMGKDWAWCRENFSGDKIQKIISHLEANYDSDAWYSPR